jgi:glycosyltransferase involved in cell wall biosynthesis
MPARLAAADVFVFPSLFEGSAVVTYEALASGLPSVVTPQAGSVVRDGIEGLLVAAGEIDGLAERLERLGKDRSLRREMGAAARARAIDFDWHRYHTSLIEAADEWVHGTRRTDLNPIGYQRAERNPAHSIG